MGNASKKKGSILMEYLMLLVIVGMTLAVYFAENFYSFPDAAVASDPRVNPAGFYADASEIADVSMNTDINTNKLFHGIHFVRFYQRTMGGIALPVP